MKFSGVFIFLAFGHAAISQHTATPGIPMVPLLQSSYKQIYQPKSDIFSGPGDSIAKAGQRYSNWIPNDHTFIKSHTDGAWHIFGITRPDIPGPIHNYEYQSLHAKSSTNKFASSFSNASWSDLPKVLPPSSRPGETNYLWAPHVIFHDHLYYMFYGPGSIYYATSENLNDWKSRGTAFIDSLGTRDPNVQLFDGVYYLYYCKGRGVSLRTSADLQHWSEPTELIQLNMGGSMESPFVIFHEGYYYLFWTIFDGTNSSFDWRTTIVRSKTPDGFGSGETLGILLSHAPEIITTEDQHFFISSVEWPVRGISAASLGWISGPRFPVLFNAIPGTIEAEHFDNGGEGISYHISDPVKDKKLYRTIEQVTIERNREKNYDVVSFTSGDWLAYTVSVEKLKSYDIEILITAQGKGKASFHLEMDGKNITGAIPVIYKGPERQIIKRKSIKLSSGRHDMKIVMDKDDNKGINISSFSFR
ncbi:MAG: carbohydrate-binding protein [Flavitalea sp.]